ncbi:MAG: HAMP domain-containing histidine kinase [Hyphomicrobiales bacterium]|nr:HAMP domain-containing histidine kinase [Hyphomicrobiales bacterium]MCP4999690.1 HAMP domain-containing histidine kinase [Hyphomicrobiales bacterium]
MLDGLVDISKLESGGIAADTGPVDLSRLVDDVLDEFAHAANEKQIRLQVQADRCFADTDAYL